MDALLGVLNFAGGIVTAHTVNEPIFVNGFNVYLPSIVEASSFAGVIQCAIVSFERDG